MVFSTDAGLTWNRNLQLDGLMTGDGIFRYQNQKGPTDFIDMGGLFNGYFEPSLLAFDPENPGLVVAGGRDRACLSATMAVGTGCC